MITRILLALIYVQNSITMPHLVVIQLMRVIKWPRSHSHGNCVNKKGRGYKGFYSSISWPMEEKTYPKFLFFLNLNQFSVNEVIHITHCLDYFVSLKIYTSDHEYHCMKI